MSCCPVSVNTSLQDLAGRRGRRTGSLIIARDVTERKQLLEQTQHHAGELEQRVTDRTEELDRLRRLIDGFLRMATAIGYLLDNALNYTPPGGHVTITTFQLVLSAIHRASILFRCSTCPKSELHRTTWATWLDDAKRVIMSVHSKVVSPRAWHPLMPHATPRVHPWVYSLP